MKRSDTIPAQRALRVSEFTTAPKRQTQPMDWDVAFDALRASPDDGSVVSMICLGTMGRWGNTCLQYLFLRAFALEYGLRVQTPPWLGEQLFDLNDERVVAWSPNVVLDCASQIYGHAALFWVATDIRMDRAATLRARHRRVYALRDDDAIRSDAPPLPFRNLDLEGLFFVHTRHLAPHRQALRSCLRPIRPVQQCLDTALSRLRSRGETIVGIHVRLGDLKGRIGFKGFEYVAPALVYRRWLERVWPTLNHPVLFLATDTPDVVGDWFSEFGPVTSRELGAEMPDGIDIENLPQVHKQRDLAFFPDWYLLTQCDHVAISNSTFSFSACMFNERAGQFVRPSPESGELEPFDPWDAEPLQFFSPSPWIPIELYRRVRAEYRVRRMRSLPRLLLEALRFYRLILRHRKAVLRFYRDRRSVRTTLLSPAFYLASRRRYDA